MTRLVAVDDLIDAQGVADILCLAHRNTVSQYQRRYDDMPKPVVDLGNGRVKLWLRSEITRGSRSSTPPAVLVRLAVFLVDGVLGVATLFVAGRS